ncbi:23S rRNA pseudouridylate synthase C [Actinobacillus pleuropneumoniae]|nr:23S rRNA pseudouridylate synthase C [Actinobacillus pleuropneumoniae]KIE94945.1 23S rRNA pseudouridylate synthase C [Actinobacillus pleuropneumoniae]KIE95134.1 23S rRNA pseudouridylate synthase C [Actinobacillus pleuropneumoniae]
MKKAKMTTEKVISASVQFFTISEDEAGQRLDNFLLAKLKGVPKSLIYRIVRKGEVRVNKGRIKLNINFSLMTWCVYHRCV